MVRKRRGPTRSADGSLAVSDEKRLELIEKAFRECGFKPTKKMVEEQFRYETNRLPGEEKRSYRGGNKARSW